MPTHLSASSSLAFGQAEGGILGERITSLLEKNQALQTELVAVAQEEKQQKQEVQDLEVRAGALQALVGP